MTDIKFDNVEDTLFSPVNSSVEVVNKSTGEVFATPHLRYRTISDLHGYKDDTKFTQPSVTDTTEYIPFNELVDSFFRQGQRYDGFDDVEDFDSPEVPDDDLDVAEEMRNLSTTGQASEQPIQKASEQAGNAVDNISNDEKKSNNEETLE